MKGIKIVVFGFALIIATGAFRSSQAQTYPSQPVQIVITLAPGDSLDLTGRAISTELSKILNGPRWPSQR